MKETKYSTYEIRLRAVQAVHQGMSVQEVAKAYHTHRATVYRWLERYEREGNPKGLARKPGSGRPRKLEELTPKELTAIVLQPASRFGFETDFWTCKRLRTVIRQTCQIGVSKWTIWRRIREAGLTYQKPERKYFEASEELRQKWLNEELPTILQTVKKYKAILYFEDESNISLTAFLGKTWALRGKTPTQKVTGARGGVSAMSAISKQGTLLFTLHEKRIASEEIIHFLDQILKHHKRRHIVLVMDQARPHTSKKTQQYIESQKRLHVFYLPPYSPDWNPDEQVWNHLKHQELKGHQAKTKEDMKKLAHNKLTEMSNNSHIVRGIFFRCFIADLLQ